MNFFKALGRIHDGCDPRPRGVGAGNVKQDSARPQAVAVPGAAGGPDLRLRPGCRGTGDGSSRSSGRRAARCPGRQESLQPGLLLDRDLCRLNFHRTLCRVDHRLHRRGWRLHHRARPDVGRYQRHPRGWHRSVPHLRQGDHGERHSPQAGQYLRSAGRRPFSSARSAEPPLAGSSTGCSTKSTRYCRTRSSPPFTR